MLGGALWILHSFSVLSVAVSSKCTQCFNSWISFHRKHLFIGPRHWATKMDLPFLGCQEWGSAGSDCTWISFLKLN